MKRLRLIFIKDLFRDNRDPFRAEQGIFFAEQGEF